MENDPIYQRAQARLREVIKERQELESFLSLYRTLAKEGCSEPLPASAMATVIASSVEATTEPKSWPTEKVLLAVGEVLADKRCPVRLGDLHVELTKRGVVVGGKSPVNNLGAKLSADPRFETIKGHGWWFRGELLPNGYAHEVEEFEIEKGPEAFSPEPSHMNGATEDHTARNGH